VNRRDSSDIDAYNTANAISDNDYNYYGRYFALDQSGTTKKLYASSYENDQQGRIHQIEVTSVCTHGQSYTTSTDSCSSISSTHLTIGLQDTSATQCSSNGDSTTYNRFIGESVCDYGCANKKFGKNCETCSSYMTRVGVSAGTGNQWYDDSNYKCYAIDAVTGGQSCTEYTSCSTCIYSSSCDFSSYSCQSTTETIQKDAYSVFQRCSAVGITEHDYNYCGPSTVNLQDYNSSYSPKPTNVVTPTGTLCRYNFQTTAKFTDTFTITIDNSAEIIVKQTKNGVTSTVTPSRRVLNSEDGKRRLTTTSSYSVTSADLMSIYYIASSDLASAIFLTTSGKNYFTSTSSSGGDGIESDTSPVQTDDEKTSESPIGLIVATIIIVLLMLMIGTCAFVWYKCSKKRERNYRDGNGNHVLFDGTNEPIPEEVGSRLRNMRELEYQNKCDMFNMTNCVICLDDFVPGSKVRQMPFCEHIFHSKCIEEVLRVSHRIRKYRCPLCN
jgi:hypothetical protein